MREEEAVGTAKEMMVHTMSKESITKRNIGCILFLCSGVTAPHDDSLVRTVRKEANMTVVVTKLNEDEKHDVDVIDELVFTTVSEVWPDLEVGEPDLVGLEDCSSRK